LGWCELSLDQKQVRALKIVKGVRKRVKACSLVEGQADRLGWIKKLAESLGYWVDIGYKVMRLTRFEAKENKRCGYLVYTRIS